MAVLLMTSMTIGCGADEDDKAQADEATSPTDSASATTDDSGMTPAPDSGDDSAADTSTPTDSADPRDTGSVPEPPVNLLANPGFEEDDTAWNIWGGAIRDADHALSGDWSLKATDRNGAEQVVSGLEPNMVYRLSGWGKTTGPDPLLIGVKDYGGDEQRVSFYASTYEDDTLTFTTGFANTTATIYAYKHSGSEPGYADDMFLQLEGPSELSVVWSDEFDGEGALDESKWTFESGFVRNEEVQWYQSENAFQEDGMLVIEGRAEERPNPDHVPGSTDWRTSRETITHTSASVTTLDRYSWQYGHLVVRAKVTNDGGTWPAIWTLGVDCEWPSNGEVDVMENYGGDILANFAWGTDTRWSPRWDSSHWPVADFGAGWTDDFHIWEWEWTSERMVIRLDGVTLNDVSLESTINGTAACAGDNPFQQEHRLLLNLALGGSAGGSIADLAFPTRYLIDYVRVYQ